MKYEEKDRGHLTPKSKDIRLPRGVPQQEQSKNIPRVMVMVMVREYCYQEGRDIPYAGCKNTIRIGLIDKPSVTAPSLCLIMVT